MPYSSIHGIPKRFRPGMSTYDAELIAKQREHDRAMLDLAYGRSKKRKEKKSSYIDKQQKRIKKMTIWDWQLTKLSLILFGIMAVSFYPEMATWMEWYWWWAIVIIFAAPTLYRMYQKPKTRKNSKYEAGPLMSFYRKFKYSQYYSDWAFVKFSVIIFGIGLAVLLPQLIEYEWYIWFLAGLLVLAIPVYFLYHYAPPKTATKHSIARAKYARSESNENLKNDEAEIPGVYKTMKKVEDQPKSVKVKTEVVFYPKGKKAKEILKKTGQLSKKYGKEGVGLLKKEIVYAKNWPSRIDKKTEENLKTIEEKYGPLKIKYHPEKEEEANYERSKLKKKSVKRKTTKRKPKNK